MEGCAEKGCPALATRGVYCPIHASGLRKYVSDDGRHCAGCSKRLKTETWITVNDNGQSFHYPRCKATAKDKRQ
jgi:hypothetical protein